MFKLLSWPFLFAGGLIAFILSAIGRIFAMGLGFALVIIGVMLCMTVFGIIVGAPLAAFGLALVIKSIS